jgi:hypothetical protein
LACGFLLLCKLFLMKLEVLRSEILMNFTAIIVSPTFPEIEREELHCCASTPDERSILESGRQ